MRYSQSNVCPICKEARQHKKHTSACAKKLAELHKKPKAKNNET